MIYSIYIGEGTVENIDGEFVACVQECAVPSAPSFEHDDMTGKSNGRHPGYSAWDNFTKRVGLRDLFFDKESGLMRKHPGTFALTTDHEQAISLALERYKRAHPDAKPGFYEDEPNGLDPILARLVWLDFWVRWALANCKKPAIHNH